jgi:hypothetical protein
LRNTPTKRPFAAGVGCSQSLLQVLDDNGAVGVEISIHVVRRLFTFLLPFFPFLFPFLLGVPPVE